MADRISRERRSWNMSRIRSKNTRPELAVRKLMHAMGLRFRLHDPKLPGRPDIVLRKHRTVVFVHGCFWHRHPGCRYSTTPSDNAERWLRKFERNVQRDKEVTAELEGAGWQVLCIWSCETADTGNLRARIAKVFGLTDTAWTVHPPVSGGAPD